MHETIKAWNQKLKKCSTDVLRRKSPSFFLSESTNAPWEKGFSNRSWVYIFAAETVKRLLREECGWIRMGNPGPLSGQNALTPCSRKLKTYSSSLLPLPYQTHQPCFAFAPCLLHFPPAVFQKLDFPYTNQVHLSPSSCFLLFR